MLTKIGRMMWSEDTCFGTGDHWMRGKRGNGCWIGRGWRRWSYELTRQNNKILRGWRLTVRSEVNLRNLHELNKMISTETTASGPGLSNRVR